MEYNQKIVIYYMQYNISIHMYALYRHNICMYIYTYETCDQYVKLSTSIMMLELGIMTN